MDLVCLPVILLFHFVRASDVNKIWDFASSSNYTISDSSALEYSGTSVRLKAQNYTSDSNTAALYHFDEGSGGTAADSSSNSNSLSVSGVTWGVGNLNSSLTFDGSTSAASVADSSSLSLTQSNTLEGWTKLGSSFSSYSQTADQPILDKGAYKLYLDHETGKLTYELQNSSATTWTQQGGNEINNGWDLNGKSQAESSTVLGSNMYVGTGASVGDAEVWKYTGSAWTQIGGDGYNSGWASNTYEEVMSLTNDGTNIYAGLGTSTGDAEVWKWNGSTWTKIGGDAVNSSWALSTYEGVQSLNYFSGNLYAGLGTGTGDGEVWKWNGTAWSKIGGDGVNSSWAAAANVASLANDGTNLYAATGVAAGDGDVWKWNGTTWTQIGGDAVNSSWAASTYEQAQALYYQGGNLYVGLGTSTGDAEVWRWSGSAWTRLAYSGTNFPAATYEAVYSITGDGTNIYVGTGNSQNDGDVWKYTGSAWSQIGGDGLSSGWTQGYVINTLAWYNSKLFADSTQASTGDVMYSYNGTSWSREAGQYYNGSWGYYNLTAVQSMTTYNGKLYAGLTSSSNGAASVFEFDGSNWRLVGASGLNSGWTSGTNTSVNAMAGMGGNLYVGLVGTQNGDGDVWKWNGSTWTQVGGDGLNSGWAASTYSRIYSMTTQGSNLYVGIGSTSNNAEVWKWNGSTWTKIGGTSVNSSWPNTVYRNINTMTFFQGNLYVGATGSANAASDVWKWNGSTWTQVGGDGLNSSWNMNSTANATVGSLVAYNGKLYAGIGSLTVGDASVWQYNGSTWTKIGGDDVNSSWTSNTYEQVYSLATYNGDLYAGLGLSSGNGEVWKLSGSTWSQVGGDGLNSGWSNAIETVHALQTYHGKLYAALGDTQNADAMVYSFGNNGYLQGSTTSFDTNWHHIAATYDGATMKVYIDGTLNGSTSVALSMPDTNHALLIGQNYGSMGADSSQSVLSGSLDELRISNTVRSSFTTKPYSANPVSIKLASANYTSGGIASWDNFSDSTTLNGGTVKYRLSTDQGTTWKYWNGSTWADSNGLTEATAASTIGTHVSALPVGINGIMWQAVLQGDGTQQVQLDSVTLAATADSTPPAANASSVVIKRSSGGDVINNGDWTNASTPYFSWSPANDSQSSILGYCVYVGTDSNADPVTTKGLLGTSPVNVNSDCPYVVSGTSLNLATSGVLATPLSTSNSPYYIKIKAIDNAQNIYSGTSASANFRFDDTAPTNPLFVSTPSQFVSSKQVNVTWPTADANAANDNNSGVAGLQYRIGSSGTWYGDAHTGSQSSSDLLANDGSYETVDPPDFDSLHDGNNTIYFRTYDNAGNVSTTYVTGVIKINTVSPTSPLNVTATPSTNTTNSFAFNWQPPASYGGSEGNLVYCYTINTLPSANTCTFTAAGVTNLSAGAYATQPGDNTFYVVAKDEAGNINYATYGQATFTANTAAPGIPLNTDVADISVKATSNWRLALSWDAPTDTGAGIASYKVYRSTDGNTFSNVASTSGTSYVDGGLQSIKYYYKIKACDSANNCGALTSAVSITPTGKFTSPAELVSQPKVTDISTRKATIQWSTDRDSDSRIQYGLKTGDYFNTEAAISAQTTDHQIVLNNLTAGTTYYFKARWTDIDGNIGSSTEKSFTTSPAPVVKEVTSTTTLTTANINFTSKDAYKVKIYYGKSEGFGGTQTLNTSPTESSYAMQLNDLEDGTKYFFKLNTTDADGNEYEGNVYSLTTPARPKISNVRFQPVENQPSSTQKVSWTTNVPTDSVVAYGVGNLEENRTDSKLTTEHEITIQSLKDDSVYQLVARSRDASGNLATSDIQTFKTALDTRPPKIYDITVDVAIRGSGGDARGQIVVSWKTDEPSTSQVAYGAGSSGQYSSVTSEDTKLSTDHVIVISDLSTSRVYHLEPRSFDKARNQASGTPQVAIVGRGTENVLSIIINALQNIFGVNAK